LAHPIILQHWQRLTQWLDEQHFDRQFAKTFLEDAATWHDYGQANARLYRGVQLERALEWAERNQPPEAGIAFLDAALALRDSQQVVSHETLASTQSKIERDTQQ